MPKFRNKNSHPVYVRPSEDEALVKVKAGAEIEATGGLADALSDTEGVEKVAAKKSSSKKSSSKKSSSRKASSGGSSGTITTEDVPTRGS